MRVVFLYSRKHIRVYFSFCEFVQMLEKKIIVTFRLEKTFEIESHCKHNTDKSSLNYVPKCHIYMWRHSHSTCLLISLTLPIWELFNLSTDETEVKGKFVSRMWCEWTQLCVPNTVQFSEFRQRAHLSRSCALGIRLLLLEMLIKQNHPQMATKLKLGIVRRSNICIWRNR